MPSVGQSSLADSDIANVQVRKARVVKHVPSVNVDRGLPTSFIAQPPLRVDDTPELGPRYPVIGPPLFPVDALAS